MRWTMATKRRRRGGIRPAQIAESLPLLTLASLDVLGETLNNSNVDKPTRVMSVDVLFSLNGMTALEGPVDVGLSHSDYTDAEVEQALEATGSWASDDKIAREQSNRLVRRVGQLDAEHDELNDGKPVRVRLNWALASGSTIRYWARNVGSGALTTGAILTFNGTAWLTK